MNRLFNLFAGAAPLIPALFLSGCVEPGGTKFHSEIRMDRSQPGPLALQTEQLRTGNYPHDAQTNGLQGVGSSAGANFSVSPGSGVRTISRGGPTSGNISGLQNSASGASTVNAGSLSSAGLSGARTTSSGGGIGSTTSSSAINSTPGTTTPLLNSQALNIGPSVGSSTAASGGTSGINNGSSTSSANNNQFNNGLNRSGGSFSTNSIIEPSSSNLSPGSRP